MNQCPTCQDRRLVGGFLPASCPTCCEQPYTAREMRILEERDAALTKSESQSDAYMELHRVATERLQAMVAGRDYWLEEARRYCERVEELKGEVERLTKESGRERDHSKMLSESSSALYVEKRAVENYCAKVRGEYTEAKRERDALRAECERMRADLAHWEAVAERDQGKPFCSCTYEAGDSRCIVHPRCNCCGAVTDIPRESCSECRSTQSAQGKGK